MENDELNHLKEIYIKSLHEKFIAIQQFIETLRRNTNLETLKELRLTIHKMAGSAGTYGYPAVSDICRVWDQTFAEMILSFPACQKDLSWLNEFERTFAKIKQEFSRHG